MMSNIVLEGYDKHSWIKNKLSEMNFVVDDSELSPSIVSCLQSLLFERHRMQEQGRELVEDCSKLRAQLDMYGRDKETLGDQLLILKQDLNNANDRNALMQSTNRELRNQWLNEKRELEGRCFQIQALQTQLQGTLRKKEKDHDKLQQQLAKVVKDASRQQKSMLTLSKPLARTTSQVKQSTTLRDAESLAYQESVQALELENRNLRDAVNDLTSSYCMFQAKMTAVLAQKEEVRAPPAVLDAVIKYKADSRRARSDCESNIENAVLAHPNVILTVSDSGSSPSNPDKAPATPSRTSTSFGWLVQQTDSVVKALRSKAENLSSNSDVEAADVESLRRQLEEAQAVIREQDYLIHAALVGKLPSFTYDDTELLEFESSDRDGRLSASVGRRRSSFGVGNSNRRLSSDSVIGSPFFAKLLPPASPDTIRVLQASGLPLPSTLNLSDGSEFVDLGID